MPSRPNEYAPPPSDLKGREQSSAGSRLSRRGLLSLAGVGGAAAGLAAGFLGHDAVAASAAPAPAAVDSVVPFHGVHQAGITTPAQDRLHMAAFDVTTDKREEHIQLPKDWTKAAAALTEGRPAGATGAVNGP
ncbi:MAG TPA: Dyp-type peroxidase domain-containing protein, partial [Arthrobacter sp.]